MFISMKFVNNSIWLRLFCGSNVNEPLNCKTTMYRAPPYPPLAYVDVWISLIEKKNKFLSIENLFEFEFDYVLTL